MADFVFLQDFKRPGVSFRGGTVISDDDYNVTELQAIHAPLKAHVVAMDPVITAYNTQRDMHDQGAVSLHVMLEVAGL